MFDGMIDETLDGMLDRMLDATCQEQSDVDEQGYTALHWDSQVQSILKRYQ